MRPWVLVLVLLAGCAQQLPARALTAFPSYEAWCAQLKGARCRGEWPGAKGGQSALGAYRFVEIEAAAIENFGGGPSVSLELQTAQGFVYQPLGAIGATGRSGTTTLKIEGVTEHPGALDLRTHARAISDVGMTDTQQANLFVQGAGAVGVAHVHLGTSTRDERGRARGQFGELKWAGQTLVSRGTSLKDGEHRLVAP